MIHFVFMPIPRQTDLMGIFVGEKDKLDAEMVNTLNRIQLTHAIQENLNDEMAIGGKVLFSGIIEGQILFVTYLPDQGMEPA